LRLGNAPKNHRLRGEPVSQLGVRTIAQICMCLSLFGGCDAGARADPPPHPIELPKPAPLVNEPNLAYLPVDADLVMRIDVATLRKSKLFATYERYIAKQLVSGTAECEYQLLDDVTSVMVGVALKPEHEVLVFRGIDRDKMMRCLRMPDAAKFDGDFATVKNKSTFDVLTFVDAKTMVVNRAKEATRPALVANTTQDTALIAALRNLPPKAGFAVASRPGDEELATKWSTLGAHLETMSGTLDLDAQLKIEVAIVLKTPDEATRVTNELKGQFKSLEQTFDRIDVNAQDRTMTVEIVLGETKLASLMSMVGGMM
jgi:hypothetical protein